jgi:hypothetical protein
VRRNINVRSFAPDPDTCQLPAGTSYAIQSKDGSTVRCKFRPFPVDFNGIPQMVYLPIDALPEQLHVRVDIRYLDTNTGQTVTKIGGRQLFNTVHVIEATGGAQHFDNRWFWSNRILDRHSRRWGPGPHQITIDTHSIDSVSRQQDYRSPMRSLAFVFEWEPAPPTPNFRPTWEITVLSKRFDADSDGIFDRDDLCPLDADPTNANLDGDHLGDVCDPDLDNDGIPNDLDRCPATAGSCAADRDGHNLPDDRDNCPDIANWDQADSDGDGQGDACDSDSKPDLVITEGSIPPAGAGFVVKNVGTAPAKGPLRYHVSGHVTGPAGRLFFQRTLDFPLRDNLLAPGARASTEIPEDLIDPARRSSYENVRVTIDSNDEVEELDETNNSLAIR